MYIYMHIYMHITYMYMRTYVHMYVRTYIIIVRLPLLIVSHHHCNTHNSTEARLPYVAHKPK